MSRRYGKARCQTCGTWFSIDESHTCPSTAAVMTAAFGGPGRVVGSFDTHCWDEACEHRAWERTFELDREIRLDLSVRAVA